MAVFKPLSLCKHHRKQLNKLASLSGDKCLKRIYSRVWRGKISQVWLEQIVFLKVQVYSLGNSQGGIVLSEPGKCKQYFLFPKWTFLAFVAALRLIPVNDKNNINRT